MFTDTIQTKILDFCRKNGGVTVNVYHKGSNQLMSCLPFDINGNAKVLSGNVVLITYLSNIIEYTRKDILIKLGETDLSDVLKMEPPALPPTINTDLNQD